MYVCGGGCVCVYVCVCGLVGGCVCVKEYGSMIQSRNIFTRAKICNDMILFEWHLS